MDVKSQLLHVIAMANSNPFKFRVNFVDGKAKCPMGRGAATTQSTMAVHTSWRSSNGNMALIPWGISQGDKMRLNHVAINCVPILKNA